MGSEAPGLNLLARRGDPRSEPPTRRPIRRKQKERVMTEREVEAAIEALCQKQREQAGLWDRMGLAAVGIAAILALAVVVRTFLTEADQPVPLLFADLAFLFVGVALRVRARLWREDGTGRTAKV
jgi:anti-sigma-K factor RskA